MMKEIKNITKITLIFMSLVLTLSCSAGSGGTKIAKKTKTTVTKKKHSSKKSKKSKKSRKNKKNKNSNSKYKYTYKSRGRRFKVLRSAKGFKQTGEASWYGPGFQGRKTANGDRFDMNALTAAHKTLPLGTMIEVTNLGNNKKIIVKVNDRGPFSKGRILDLSKRAARKLGIIKRGHGRVRIKALTK